MSLYPDPPHLSLAVYSEQPEWESFSTLCRIVVDAGCSPTFMTQTAPWDLPFTLLSDLAGVTATTTLDPATFRSVVFEKSKIGRPIRAGYSMKRYGRVVVVYQPGFQGRHPLGVSLSAHQLGLPQKLWRGIDRRAAGNLAAWTTQLLSEACNQCQALYAAIGVEFTLPTPPELLSGVVLPASEIFVSQQLIDQSPRLADALRRSFTGIPSQEWETGLFFSGWGPFNSAGVTLSDFPGRLREGSRELGKALRERT